MKNSIDKSVPVSLPAVVPSTKVTLCFGEIKVFVDKYYDHLPYYQISRYSDLSHIFEGERNFISVKNAEKYIRSRLLKELKKSIAAITEKNHSVE